jgi:3-oxoacyl-[acyl-carrier protein] reductase
MDFCNKKILITGASRGIGKATAIEFSKRGGIVGINYTSNDEEALKTIGMLENSGHKLFKYDISKVDSQKELIDSFVSEFGAIDILINNAGIIQKHEIDNISFDAWQKSWKEIFDVNLFAAANLCFLASEYMIRQGGGRIVNVSSRGAFRGEPDMPAYGASKAALNAMTQSLAKKLAKYNIFVSAVAPGFVDTDMGTKGLTDTELKAVLRENPLGRMATAEEVAYSILFLASENSAYNTGAILDINGASYLRT